MSRLPWSYAETKTREWYRPVVSNKSKSDEEIEALKPNEHGQLAHIGRIMETELGEQRLYGLRFTHCISLDQEC